MTNNVHPVQWHTRCTCTLDYTRLLQGEQHISFEPYLDVTASCFTVSGFQGNNFHFFSDSPPPVTILHGRREAQPAMLQWQNTKILILINRYRSIVIVQKPTILLYPMLNLFTSIVILKSTKAKHFT